MQRRDTHSPFRDPAHGDLVIVINNDHDNKLHAERAVLTFVSPVFRSMLSTSGMKETQQQEIHLEEDPRHASGFEVFLAYIYPCSTIEVTSSNVKELLHFGDKYCVSGKLVNECEAFLLEEGRTSWDLLLLAQRYGLKKLLQTQVEWACCDPDTNVRLRWDDINPETCRLFLLAFSRKINNIRRTLYNFKDSELHGELWKLFPYYPSCLPPKGAVRMGIHSPPETIPCSSITSLRRTPVVAKATNQQPLNKHNMSKRRSSYSRANLFSMA